MHRHRRSTFLILILLLAVACRLGGCAAGPACDSARTAGESLLDGREKSLIVVGYSTSFAWPDMLQAMLDEHTPGERRYHVLNATVGGAAVERWIADPGTPEYERTIVAMDRDYFGPRPRLRGDAPAPTVALCQQSLQFTRTRRGPIADAADQVGVDLGADALEHLVERLRERGLERIYIGMHIYKAPIEPEVGNERLALAALLEHGHPYVFEGPDVWTPTRDAYPECFAEDGIHPNELGMKIMVEGWYRIVAGSAAREDVIARMRARDWDIETMMRDYVRRRSGE